MGNSSRPIWKFGTLFVLTVCAHAMSFALGFAVQPSFGAGLPCSYEVTAIIQGPYCDIFGYPPTTASSISPNGRYVCGSYDPCVIGDDRAFVYDTKTQEFITLPLGSGFYAAWAEDVNDDGVVCGGGWKDGPGQRGWVYHLATGEWTELPSQNGAVGWSSATAINSFGVVCGWRSVEDGGDPVHPWNAFIWSPKQGFTDLGVMIGEYSTATAISDGGVVVGHTGTPGTQADNTSRAFIYANGQLTIMGPVPNGINSAAWDVNEAGQIMIVGKIQLNPTIAHAFVYQSGDWLELLPLPGYILTISSAISESGIPVGVSRIPGQQLITHACVWFGQGAFDLNLQIPGRSDLFLEIAIDIANDGLIVVNGKNGDGDRIVALLLPVMPALGDANCDGLVDVDDLLGVINGWGACGVCSTDFDDDGQTNVSDLLIVIDNWSQ